MYSAVTVYSEVTVYSAVTMYSAVTVYSDTPNLCWHQDCLEIISKLGLLRQTMII